MWSLRIAGQAQSEHSAPGSPGGRGGFHFREARRELGCYVEKTGQASFVSSAQQLAVRESTTSVMFLFME